MSGAGWSSGDSCVMRYEFFDRGKMNAVCRTLPEALRKPL